MIRWSMLLMLAIASVCCLTALRADDKEKPAEKQASKTEKKSSAESQSEEGEEKATDKEETAKEDGDNKEESDKEEKFTAKCPVSNEAASKEQFASYKDKQVYFCCEKCKAAFEAEPEKFEVKANHQLVQTKQFVQKKCPISGGAVNKEQYARVSNVKVSFCCEKCKGSVQSAEADQKLEMIFAGKVFTKAFTAVKEKPADGDAKEKPESVKEEKPTDKATEKKSEKSVEKKADKPAEKKSESPKEKTEKAEPK